MIRWSPACVACHLWMPRRNLGILGRPLEAMIPLVGSHLTTYVIYSNIQAKIGDALCNIHSFCMMHFGLFADCKVSLNLFLQIIFISLQLSRSCEASRRCMWSGVVSTFRCYPCCKMVRCGGGFGVRMLTRFYHGKYSELFIQTSFFAVISSPPKKT